MCIKTNIKNKNYFKKYCLQCFANGNVLQKHKEICLKINGKQRLKLNKVQSNLKIISNNELCLKLDSNPQPLIS